MGPFELISILKHLPPTAYLSGHLPSMNELRDAATRPLNAFEVKSLEALKSGEDIVLDKQRNDLQLFKSIRATNKCVKCHSVSHGALLGAFTYRFRREPLLAEPVKEAVVH